MFPTSVVMSNNSTDQEPTAINLNSASSNSTTKRKKRSLPGNPDPDAEVIALSPQTLLATNRFVCEICNKGFQRDQNLQLHRRGHNLPWKLKQQRNNSNNNNSSSKRVYVCPEASCVHHHPSRALGDLTGIKKHYCRKHGEKKWKCDKCSKIYAVQSDWKAHSKTCGTREYRCACGTLFSRKDSFVTHRAFCDALAEESARLSAAASGLVGTLIPSPSSTSSHHQPSLFTDNFIPNPNHYNHLIKLQYDHTFQTLLPPFIPNPNNPNFINLPMIKPEPINYLPNTTQQPYFHGQSFDDVIVTSSGSPYLSATALLQKASVLGAKQESDRLTRDFLGLTGHGISTNGSSTVDHHVSMNRRDLLMYTRGVGEGFGEATPYNHPPSNPTC